MKNVFRNLWNDDAGFVISGELIFIFTLLVIGLIVGWTNVRNAVVAELTETANAILSISQQYQYSSVSGCSGANVTAGVNATDTYTTLVNSSATASSASISVQNCP